MLTAQTLAVEGLSYIGVFAVAATEPSWSTVGTARNAILNRIAHDQTAAIQDVYRARFDLYQARVGVVAPGVETHNVLLTSGSTAVNLSNAVFANNLDGATVQANGLWNETLRPTPNAAVTLLHPYGGATGTYPLTVWGDSIVLDTSKYARVVGDVYREGVALAALPNRDAFTGAGAGWTSDYGGARRRGRGLSRHPGPPEAYWVESTSGPAGPILRLRVAPFPDRLYPLDLDVELRAPIITAANLAADDGTDPGIIFKLPAGLDESILSALFLGRFCKSPWVKDAEHRAFLVQDAEGAMKKLMAFQKQAESGASMKSRGFGF